jgi:SAM-dependent methyltransferase
MIGQATARLEPAPRRWIQTAWGHGDIDMRQKWWAVWPQFETLPTNHLRVLDAGCGAGRWALELASRRPEWHIQGIDFNGGAIAAAERARQRLGVTNVSFVHSEFLHFEPEELFDVVLAVYSALYLAEQGEGMQLFRKYSTWLKPGGRLILMDTRWEGSSPFYTALPHPRQYHRVFSFDELSRICQSNGLIVEQLRGCIGPLGIAAKQLGWATSGQPTPARERPSRMSALHQVLYPIRYALAWLDSRRAFRPDELTLMLLLVARASSTASASGAAASLP